MGRMKFGNSPSATPVILQLSVEDVSILESVVDTVEQPLTTVLPPVIEYRDVEKIVYVDKPIEIIKTIEVPVEVVKYVNVDVIKEVEKIVLVDAPILSPEIITKEIIVEKQVKNNINTIIVYALVISMLVNILQVVL